MGHDPAATAGARAEPVGKRPADGRADGRRCQRARAAEPGCLERRRRRLPGTTRTQLAGDAKAWGTWSLVQASAEAVPLADASFDIVFWDHGAMNFADPYRTVPEVARLLRPGGLFAFCHLSPIADLCWPR